ncbi:MAG: hypothetical protein M3N16_06280 [Actinomycetota bacterium]|nr:hypothetical protein [Actinomycetota bacterium]
MQLLVLLFFCGLSAGAVAKLRGNGFLLWFLIGFCLPLIGTVAALVARSDAHELRRRCDECGKVLALHDQVCMRCGADLDFPEAVLAPPVSPGRRSS